MAHAIDNADIRFILFSKLTSHDWAQHLRLSAPKESNAIETLDTVPASHHLLSISLLAASTPPCGSEESTHEREVRLTIWVYLPSSKAD